MLQFSVKKKHKQKISEFENLGYDRPMLRLSRLSNNINKLTKNILHAFLLIFCDNAVLKLNYKNQKKAKFRHQN